MKLLLEKQERDHESFVERTGQVGSCQGKLEAVAGLMRRGGMMRMCCNGKGPLVLSVPLATKPDLFLPLFFPCCLWQKLSEVQQEKLKAQAELESERRSKEEAMAAAEEVGGGGPRPGGGC